MKHLPRRFDVVVVVVVSHIQRIGCQPEMRFVEVIAAQENVICRCRTYLFIDHPLLELCRCSSDLFLSSRPRIGLATTYITGYG